MKRFPFLVLILVAGSFLAFNSMGKSAEVNPPGKYEQILRLVGRMLNEAHYSPQTINDAFSKKVYAKYLKELDGDKNMFLQSDLASLKVYETMIDDEIKGAPVASFLEVGKLFNKRMEEASLICNNFLSKAFDFNVDEDVQLDGDKLSYASNENERKDRWRKKLKYLTLERYNDLLELREKNKGKDNFVVKTDEELEKDAREKVKRLMDRSFDRYRHKFTDDDKFNVFVNAITTTMDPHSEFFPPVDKRYFDEEMSGRFFGIGASLQYDDGNIKVSSVITGSPAWKSGEIQPGDFIIKVGQGAEEPVDLTGYIVTDAVKIIRGKIGTEVRLTVKKTDGSIKVVILIRDEIVQDETFARSAIVKNNTSKLGYIYLPEFYADFDHPETGARCYIDVAKEIEKLKAEKVDGIIMDLRNNGGGSLYDVVQMAGLFIEEGPIVQVKDRDNRPSMLKDKDKSVLYDGPLAVMVNEFSASASEIFAAAIQDYNRGVIIGSTSTYGKGTVQRNIGLEPEGFSMTNAELGSVKLTLQKFYRINGGSTQLKGVFSDVILPDNLEYLKVREKDDPDALPWDEVAKAPYTPWKPGYSLGAIQQLNKQRVDADNTFKLIRENSEWLAKENDKHYSLKLDKYKKEQASIRTTVKQLESLLKLKTELDVSALPKETNRWANDKAKQERFDLWIKDRKKDIYLDQAVKVMNDMINQQNLAKKGF